VLLLDENQITKEGAMFYLDMINSRFCPTYKPKLGQKKQYHKLLKQPNSEEYHILINVYQRFRDQLSEREKTILDLQYKISGTCQSLNDIGKLLGISTSAIAHIRNKAEIRLSRRIWYFITDRKPIYKESFCFLIKNQPDEVLVQIGHATRSWDPIIKYYYDRDQN
jgi:hypothetical protein